MLILGGVGMPFPEDATFILCGFLIQRNMIKAIPALLVIYIGVLIADFIIYLFGRKFGRMVVYHRWFQKILSPERLAMLENKYQKKGIFLILLGRHVLGLRAQIFLVSGVMRMHPLKFLLTDAIAVTVTIAVMVSIGYVGGHSLKDIGIDTSMIKYVVFFLLITIFISYLVLKYIRSKRRH
jgi:membrane protein DedA with SNARE-associated domain